MENFEFRGRIYTEADLQEAREWLGDCFTDIDFSEMEPGTILAGVARHCDGGLAEFDFPSYPL